MAKTLLIHWYRYLYTDNTTIGKMYFEYDDIKDYFGYTLEDTVRPANIKVMKSTAIPADLEMKVNKFENTHFGQTLILSTEEDGITIKANLLKWVGCLFHGGNDSEDTEGCVLVASNKTSDKTIQGSLKTKLAEFIYQKMEEGYEIYALATNEPQLQ